MVDIDILVKKEDIQKSINILSGLGYKFRDGSFSQEYYLNDYHHLPLYGKYMVELHWHLSPPRPYNIILPELWKKVRHIKSGEDTITLLSPEDTIFSLALHLRRFNDPFSLKYIKDICEILKKHDRILNWTYILKYSELNKLNSLLYYVLISARINLNYPVSGKILNMFYPGILRASLIKLFITTCAPLGCGKTTPSPQGRKKYIYVFLRLLLYDSILDFIRFIILIPEEEFSRFYSIKFPSRKSSAIYSLRFLIMPFLFLNLSKKSSI
jgi:hypothetical protein